MGNEKGWKYGLFMMRRRVIFSDCYNIILKFNIMSKYYTTDSYQNLSMSRLIETLNITLILVILHFV